jgi:hypothetical protein
MNDPDDGYLRALARALFIFSLILTAASSIPALFADPHGSWASGGAAFVIVGLGGLALAGVARWMAWYLGDDVGL